MTEMLPTVPKFFIGIDPGHRTGLACFSDTTTWSVLQRYVGEQENIADSLVKAIAGYRKHDPIVAIERAEFRGSASNTKQGALVNRAYGEFFYGVLHGLGWNVQMVTPMKWKRNTPKWVVHRRIIRDWRESIIECGVPSAELDLLVAGEESDEEDVLDAAGIALWLKKSCESR